MAHLHIANLFGYNASQVLVVPLNLSFAKLGEINAHD
ncbi:hypothetical protein RKD52_004394 [Metabacillus sp. SLBN-84]